MRLVDLIAGVTVLSATLGLVVALFGPAAFGSGPGGLYGLPMMALVTAALAGLLIGGASVVRSRASGDHWRALLVVVGPLLLVLLSFDGVHLVDPCANGVWNLNSSLGGVPLCESWGTGEPVEVHRRFHLLLHGMPTAAAALLLRRGVHSAARRP